MAIELGVPSPTPTPSSRAAEHRAPGFDTEHERFLASEEGATARLIGFYAQARAELEAFLSHGQPTLSDEAFYGELLRQTDETVQRLYAGANQWAADTFPPAYVAGAQLTGGADFLFSPVHDQALRALSGYSLGLIANTNEGIRRGVQQAVASAVSTGITRDELATRIIDTGLQPGPWANVETRAGVIARTETMRAYNAGNVAAIRSTGAVAVEWHTSRDERVCPICAPLDGKVFTLPDVSEEEAASVGVPDSWAPLQGIGVKGNVLKVPPRHPRCRCTVRARYRDDSGQLLGLIPEA